MKNIIKLVVFTGILVGFGKTAQAGHGGTAVAAGFGAFTGSVIGSAVSNSGHKESRQTKAEVQAEKAKEEADAVRREQEKQRIAQVEREIDRKEMERKLEQQRLEFEQKHENKSMVVILSIIAGLLFIVVLGLMVVVFKKPQ